MQGETKMYLKDYDIIKINDGFRLVNKADPDNKFDPMDEGLFKPGDVFRVGYNGWLEHVNNDFDDLTAASATK
tara:strand:+ start:116 stop:334 length:219 start_codon:yes stop_codon:yes gene_type:complete